MSTTTMHFGPEWMRTKPQPASRTQLPDSLAPASAPPSSASTYSSLVSSATVPPAESKDETHPFRYSKEEMLRIYREGGGKGGLGLEVERWEGVVREVGIDPVGLKEMGEAEKKLFATSLNSDLRRRQSSDFLNLNTQNLERPRLNHASSASATGSPLRERFGSLMTRRRDSTDQPPLVPRKLSLTGQAPLLSPRESGLPSPRGRLGHTPGFDGILNGDSWVARRRASEGMAKAINSSRDIGEESKDLDIREEEEENNLVSKPKPEPQYGTKGTEPSDMALQQPENIQSGMAQLSVDVPVNQGHSNSPASTSTSIGPPPGIVDLAAIEWSYLDPQGQVQGPFRADLMQKWHDDGYFTPDLLMKRTTLDTDWITVADLTKRAAGGKPFLTSYSPFIPPGLIRRTDSPFSYPNEPNVFNNTPYQPSPIRTLRSATLDYSSNQSDSPGSSFGAGRFGNNSPDPAAFGGRAGQFAIGGETGGRLSGYPLTAGEGSPALAGRAAAFGIPTSDFRSTGFGNVVQGRGSLDTHGMNGGFGSPGGWPAPTTPFENNGRGSVDALQFQTGFAPSSPFVGTPGTNGFQGSFGTPAHHSIGGLAFAEQQYPPSPSAQQFSTISHNMPDIFDQQQHASARPNQNILDNSPAPPWGAVDSPISKRAIPLESTPSVSSDASAVNQTSPWGVGRGPQSGSQQNDGSPWAAPSQRITESWKEDVAPANLTVSNLGQHDQHQKQLEETAADSALNVVAETPALEDVPPEAAPEVPVAVETTLPPVTPSTKSRAKSASQQQQSAPAKTAPPPMPLTLPEPQPVPVAVAPSTPKAWAKEDEARKPTATSLRKIQDAEAKKAEARKATEREKERAARSAVAASGAPAEDVQPFTASWGLPTSKAGKGVVSATPKEAVTPSPTVTTPPVWTSTAKPQTSKKTMKEIQEEEERRKKSAAKETAANVASRRGYAESTSKPTAAPVNSGSAWSTVGPSGKAVAATPAPARPPAVPSTAAVSSSSTARVNGALARPAPIPAAKQQAANPKVEDFPITPSAEFMRWLAESLKGLNSSVNVEDIMSMLLSFSSDDPSTAEIISDLIYANTTTMDGRRFAAEFLSKRKADAVARAKAGPGAASAKTVSIADVVKAQPKPQGQSEWGGFKVVNKKKKGGRS